MSAVVQHTPIFEQIVARTLRLRETQVERFEQQREALSSLSADIEALGMDSITQRLDGDLALVISLAGGKADIKRVLTVIYRHKFEPASWPGKGDTAWFCQCTRGLFRFYLSFSSTECQRVQVRTELKEVPVYETRCVGPVMEADAQLAGPPAGPLDSDLPF